MNNKILDGYLKDFSKTQGFDNIIVNDHLVKSIDEVIYHKRNLGRLEVKFYSV
ncbi:hypothetical protein NXH76_20940 [Blautia schinkii]|nr:hypothetical protein [Blautia schinkii]